MTSTSVVKQYELTFILGETAKEEDAKQKVETLTTRVKELKGSVSKTELWGRRELAYRIKANRTGFYVTLWLDLPVSAVSALERDLRFDETIIRSLVTLAYVHAQPGSLYPVAEEDEKEKGRGRSRSEVPDENASAEAELRRTTTKTSPKKAAASDAEEEVTEEERLEKLDAALDTILKEDE